MISSLESSDDERSSSKPSQQQFSGHRNEEIPRSIDTYSCVPSWTNTTLDEDECDTDQDDDAESIAPLRMRGGGTPVVETVTDDNTEAGDDDQPQSQLTQNPLIPTTRTKIQPPQKPKYDPMKDEPPPATITPSYVPLWKKNEHWGDECEPTAMCEETEFIRIYGQNNNGISDSTGLK